MLMHVDAEKEIRVASSLTGYRNQGSYSRPLNADCFLVFRTTESVVVEAQVQKEEQVCLKFRNSKENANPRSLTITFSVQAAGAIAHAILAVAQADTVRLEGTLKVV